MAENERSSQKQRVSPGPFLAKVVNHLDPTYMGSLEVAVIKGTPGQPKTESSNVIVRYCSPFFGSTSASFEGNNSADFKDVQKSYGFWMVPPDVGSTVMVIFIDGDPNQGFWFGCVPDQYQNQMVPGIAASQYSAVGPGDESKYGTKLLPVAEFHKASRDMSVPNPDTFTKAIHPFADRLVQQGLLLDTIRGVTSSSARREVPSMVFGISTPGPVDTSVNAPRKAIGFDSSVRIPVSRLGGTQFVMDDGDKDGQNELVRIRTRTGHQILMHNSSDLIYIANSKGSAWVELSSNGKIDIYAEDSISIHSEQDFNFRADRDINIEAGRNINMQAYSGIQMQSVDRFYLTCDNEGKINIANNLQITAGAELRTKSGNQTTILSGSDMFLNSTGVMNQTSTDWKVSASGGSNITSSEHRETAGRIEMNGPAANAANTGNTAEAPDKLDSFSLPARSSGSGWTNGNFYKAGNITSIMQRVPMHEPWDQHENINPSEFTPGRLDAQVNQPADKKGSPTAGSGDSPVNGAPVAVPLSKSAAANEQYLQAVLVNAGITSPIKLAAWMAQCKVESAGFRALKEFASGAEYEGRKDLGNTQSGDGIRFKGRGFIQLTGRDVYKKMTAYFKVGIDFEAQPELVEQLEWASKSVIFFFNVYKKPGFKNRTMTQAYADTDDFWDDCPSVSALVNGGTNGLAQRKQYYAEYKTKFQTSGITPTGAVGTTSGVLTSGDGTPVQTGTSPINNK
jgi:predicted chitinase